MNDHIPSPKPPNLEQPSPEGLAAVPCSPIVSLAAALLDSGNVMVMGDGCSTRSRDLWILTDIIGRHLEPKKPKCPHCGSGLLWSEDRGAHCDGCDDFNPETDLENA